MNWETETDECALPFVKQIASGNLLYNAGCSVQCSVVTQLGGMGDGREVQGGSEADSKRSNQSILREINHEYLLERLRLKLKLQSFVPLM